jgi:hypothetical protein
LLQPDLHALHARGTLGEAQHDYIKAGLGARLNDARAIFEVNNPDTPTLTNILSLSPIAYVIAALIFAGLMLARRFGFGGMP